METKLIKNNELHILARYAKEGEVIAFPTETVYGLGVICDSEEAFEKLVKVKNRRTDKPFTLMLAFTRDIEKYAVCNAKTRAVIEAFLPGEVTLILEANKGLPYHVTLGSKYIGIRVSASLEVTNLISLVGKPLLVPSANKRDEKPALTHQEVLAIFNGEIIAVLEGTSTSHIPSTIVKLSDKIELVREGSVPFSNIQKVWEDA